MAEEKSSAYQKALDKGRSIENLRIKASDLEYDSSHSIGAGGFGEVFKTRHKIWGKKFAIKKVKDDVARIPQRYEEAMLREVTCLASLRHPNIVQLIGIVWEPNNHGILMEFMPNGDLENFISVYKLHCLLKAEILYEISQGISYIHSLPKQITHNDLKASNILISDNFVAKISDFGLADWRSCTIELTANKQENIDVKKKIRAATYTHLSPERWRDIEKTTSKSDVYSFAIIIWEIYCEKRPFSGCTDSGMIKQAVISGTRPNIEVLNDMPPKITKMMVDCWDDNPDIRPPMTTVMGELHNFVMPYEAQIKTLTVELHNQSLLNPSLLPKALNNVSTNKEAPFQAKDSNNVCIERDGGNSNAPDIDAIGSNVEAMSLQSVIPLQRQTITEDNARIVGGDGVSHSVPNSKNIALRSHNSDPSFEPPELSNSPNLPNNDVNHAQVVCQPISATILSSSDVNNASNNQPRHSALPQNANDVATAAMSKPIVSSSMLINGDNIKVIQAGDNNIIYIGPPQAGKDQIDKSGKTKTIVKKVRVPSGPVNMESLMLVSEKLGKNWKNLARRLGISDTDIDTLAYDYFRDGLQETGYQMLRKWYQQKGSEATYKVLAKALIDARLPEVALMLEACRKHQ